MKKNNNNKRKIEYMRRQRLILNGLAFDFTTPSPDVNMGITCVGAMKEGMDRLHFEIRFKPPLEKVYARTSTIEITHIESKRTDTRIVVLPSTEDKRNVSLLDSTLFYCEFATHIVKINEQGVEILFLTILNVQMRGDVDVPIWVPSFDYGIAFFPKLFNYKGLPFWPPNIEFDALEPSRIRANQQPVYFRSNGNNISGSQVAKLLGYYATMNDDNVVSGWKAVAMRFGVTMEPFIIMFYMLAHPEYQQCEEAGWWAYKDSTSMGTWVDAIISNSDNRWGLECKASKTSASFEGSHIAQCIWSMACGNTQFHDLVKYNEKCIKIDDKWTTVPSCKEARIYRNEEKEKELIDLCIKAKNSKSPLSELWASPPYVNMRAWLDNLAADATKIAKSIPVVSETVQQMCMYRQNILKEQEANCVVLDPVLDRIEKRQAHMFALYQENNAGDAFQSEVCDQIRDLVELIKK